MNIIFFSHLVDTHLFKILWFGDLIQRVSKENVFVKFLRKSFVLQFCQRAYLGAGVVVPDNHNISKFSLLGTVVLRYFSFSESSLEELMQKAVCR